MKNEFSDFVFEKDDREPFWAEIERIIQLRAPKKDKEFKPTGSWKKFVRENEGIKIYRVDSEWIRNNLLASWNHGGHGYVCEFIPIDEVWIGNTHPTNCKCKGVNNERQISERYFESAVIHETTERELMVEDMVYWQAHQLALEAEKKRGLLPDGYSEDYRPLE